MPNKSKLSFGSSWRACCAKICLTRLQLIYIGLFSQCGIYILYTVFHKKEDTILMVILLSNINRFSLADYLVNLQ